MTGFTQVCHGQLKGSFTAYINVTDLCRACTYTFVQPNCIS